MAGRFVVYPIRHCHAFANREAAEIVHNAHSELLSYDLLEEFVESAHVLHSEFRYHFFASVVFACSYSQSVRVSQYHSQSVTVRVTPIRIVTVTVTVNSHSTWHRQRSRQVRRSLDRCFSIVWFRGYHFLHEPARRTS